MKEEQILKPKLCSAFCAKITALQARLLTANLQVKFCGLNYLSLFF